MAVGYVSKQGYIPSGQGRHSVPREQVPRSQLVFAHAGAGAGQGGSGSGQGETLLKTRINAGLVRVVRVVRVNLVGDSKNVIRPLAPYDVSRTNPLGDLTDFTPTTLTTLTNPAFLREF